MLLHGFSLQDCAFSTSTFHLARRYFFYPIYSWELRLRPNMKSGKYIRLAFTGTLTQLQYNGFSVLVPACITRQTYVG